MVCLPQYFDSASEKNLTTANKFKMADLENAIALYFNMEA